MLCYPLTYDKVAIPKYRISNVEFRKGGVFVCSRYPRDGATWTMAQSVGRSAKLVIDWKDLGMYEMTVDARAQTMVRARRVLRSARARAFSVAEIALPAGGLLQRLAARLAQGEAAFRDLCARGNSSGRPVL